MGGRGGRVGGETHCPGELGQAGDGCLVVGVALGGGIECECEEQFDSATKLQDSVAHGHDFGGDVAEAVDAEQLAIVGAFTLSNGRSVPGPDDGQSLAAVQNRGCLSPQDVSNLLDAIPVMKETPAISSDTFVSRFSRAPYGAAHQTVTSAGWQRRPSPAGPVLQLQGWPCPLHELRPFAKDVVGEPDLGGIDRRLACSTSHFKPRSWMRWYRDSFALPSRGRARSGRRFGYPHGSHSAAGHRRRVDYPAGIASLER